MNKRFLLIGFALVLLLIIPLTVWIVGQQTQQTTHAEKSTNLSFSQISNAVPIGQSFNVGILLDPGTNQISFIKLVISYNKTALQQNGIAIDPKYFPVILEGPTYDQCNGDLCTMTVAASIGTDTTKLITTGGVPTQIGSVAFKVVGGDSSGTTTLSFAGGTQALSLASADAPSENVLQTPSTLAIQITGVPTPTDTIAPTSGGGDNGSGGTTGGDTTNPAPTTTTASGGTSSTTPVCSSLAADNANPTSAPASVTFTVTGSDASAVSKVTMNFGDGAVQDITTGGGIGTSTVSAQISHSYNTAGTYTATATLTNDSGGTSTPANCSQTVTVAGATASATVAPTTVATTKGGLPATGPSQAIVGAGIVGAVLTILGGLLVIGL